jgi:hypothetical protein
MIGTKKNGIPIPITISGRAICQYVMSVVATVRQSVISASQPNPAKMSLRGSIVVIVDARDNDEQVPDRFRDVQWTRLPGGDTPPAFVERVRRVLSPQPSRSAAAGHPMTAALSVDAATDHEPVRARWQSKALLLVAMAVVAVGGYIVVDRLARSKHTRRGCEGHSTCASNSRHGYRRLQSARSFDRSAAVSLT